MLFAERRRGSEERIYERVFGRVLDLFEGDARTAERWLSSPKAALGGAVPSELAETEAGARAVEALISKIELGVFT